MSFVSIEFKRFDKTAYQDIYTITDSELGEIEIAIQMAFNFIEVVAKFYIDRNLPVGRNLALATIYLDKHYGNTIEELIRQQDKYCPQLTPNWSTYAAERDRELEKLLPLL